MPDDREIVLLQRALESHIETFDAHLVEEGRRWDELVAVHVQTNATVDDLAKAMKSHTESMQGLIEAWQAANGAVKVGTALGKFLTWITKFAVIGTATLWVYSKLKDLF